MCPLCTQEKKQQFPLVSASTAVTDSLQDMAPGTQAMGVVPAFHALGWPAGDMTCWCLLMVVSVFVCASFFDFLFVCWCLILFECMMMYGHELFRALKLVAAMQLPMGTGVAGRPSNIWEALQPTEEFEKITFKIIRACILRHFSFQHDDWIFWFSQRYGALIFIAKWTGAMFTQSYVVIPELCIYSVCTLYMRIYWVNICLYM